MNRSSVARFASGLLVLAFSAFCQEATVADQDWQAFRKAYPYHVQAVAISAEHAGGSRTLIVAEPPPQVTLDALRKLSPAAFASPLVKTTKVGFDGWVKDVVVTLADSDDRQTGALVDRLNIFLFGSAYKSYALSIPKAGAPATERPKLNLQVSASDLERWLFRSKERFVAAQGGVPATMAQLLAAGKSGIYYSEEPGVVALVAPKSPLSAVRRQLREFALDSDVILGATSYGKHVAIFARERSAPVDQLPPLRTETILQLAASSGLTELSQSYERSNFFAGHIDQVGWDWAPVYLSDVLIDSEYGSLLNITDQLLKAWSSNGDVEYYRFPYPKPGRWPFDAPIILDAKVHEVTFNWNTKGAGYAIDFPEASGFRRIFSLNRTGALPVNYIPSQVDSSGENPLARYEVRGYDYFAGLSDPNLIRVVQYASLYQIFHEFGVTDTSARVKVAHPEWKYLGGIGERLVNIMLSQEADTMLKALPALQRVKAEEDLRELRVTIEKAKALFGEGIAAEIGLRFANPRIDSDLQRALASGERTRASLTRNEMRAVAAGRLARMAQESEFGQMMASVVGGSDTIYQRYVDSTRPRSDGWIRTASVVVSKTTGAMANHYYGGHNLDSTIVRYRVSAELKAGEVRQVQEGAGKVVLVSPADVDKVPGLLRKAALTGKSEDVSAVLAREMPRVAPLPARPRSVALQAEARPIGGERGLLAKVSDSRLAMLGGWKPSAAVKVNPAADFSTLGTRAIAVERLDDYSFQVFLPGSDQPRVAMSYEAAMDTVVGSMKNVDGPAGSWKLQLRGFDRDEARNFLRTTEVQFTAKENLQLAGFAPERKLSNTEMLRSLGEHYDFRRAKVTQSTLETVHLETVHQGMESLRFDVEIPAIELARPSLFMRIRIFFRTRLTEPVKQAVEAAVNAILGRNLTGAPLGERMLLDLRRDLKKMKIPGMENHDFEIEVNTEAGDFYVADIQIAGSHVRTA